MGRFIVKLDDDAYVEWSTIVELPVSYVLTRRQMARRLRRTDHGEWDQGAPDRPPEARLRRADARGTSLRWPLSVDDVLELAEGGPLTREQVMDEYRAPLSYRLTEWVTVWRVAWVVGFLLLMLATVATDAPFWVYVVPGLALGWFLRDAWSR